MRRLLVLAPLAGVLLVGVDAAAPATQGRWVMRDLGTLGGPESEVADINSHGQLVGAAETKKGEVVDVSGGSDEQLRYRPFKHAFLWQNGKMRDLGTLGGKQSSAVAINNRGQIVGTAGTKAKDKYGNPIYHAFLWQNGKMRDLGTLGGARSEATGINERGQVVGQADAKVEDGRRRYHAFLWQNGTMTELGTLGGKLTWAIDINNRGQIVGTAGTKAKDAHGYPIYRAFLWQNGKMRDLGTLGGPASEACEINERGHILGTADTKSRDESGYPISHYFLWANGKMTDLGTLGGPGVWECEGLNDRDQVVGAADMPMPPDETGGYPAKHAFLWQNGRMTDLGTLNGFDGTLDSVASDINERGQIVGWSRTPGVSDGISARPFLWQNGTMRELDTPDCPSAYGINEAVAINERGLVAGMGFAGKKCRRHAVLWTYKP